MPQHSRALRSTRVHERSIRKQQVSSSSLEDGSEGQRRPCVTVIVICDHAVAEEHTWERLAEVLEGLAEQDFSEPFEVVVAENRELSHRIPQRFFDRPHWGILPTLGTSTHQLRRHAVNAAAGDLIAFLDGDCRPDSGWLRAGVDALLRWPAVAAVGGRTVYDDSRLLVRCLGLLERGYLDPGSSRPSTYGVAGNNCIYRRRWLERVALPESAPKFSADMHQEGIRQAGGSFAFSAGMRVAHSFDGWPFERDLRWQFGYGYIACRLQEPRLRLAWLARLRWYGLPVWCLGQLGRDVATCMRVGRCFGVRWWETPVALALAVPLRLLKVPGMIAAVRQDTSRRTGFR